MNSQWTKADLGGYTQCLLPVPGFHEKHEIHTFTGEKLVHIHADHRAHNGGGMKELSVALPAVKGFFIDSISNVHGSSI